MHAPSAIPYQSDLCTVQPFEGFLRTQFKNKPGEKKVHEGQFHVLNVRNDMAVIKKEHWGQLVRPGAILTMSMVMSYIRSAAGLCPRPNCPGNTIRESSGSDITSW